MWLLLLDGKYSIFEAMFINCGSTITPAIDSILAIATITVAIIEQSSVWTTPDADAFAREFRDTMLIVPTIITLRCLLFLSLCHN